MENTLSLSRTDHIPHSILPINMFHLTRLFSSTLPYHCYELPLLNIYKPVAYLPSPLPFSLIRCHILQWVEVFRKSWCGKMSL